MPSTDPTSVVVSAGRWPAIPVADRRSVGGRVGSPNHPAASASTYSSGICRNISADNKRVTLGDETRLLLITLHPHLTEPAGVESGTETRKSLEPNGCKTYRQDLERELKEINN